MNWTDALAEEWNSENPGQVEITRLAQLLLKMDLGYMDDSIEPEILWLPMNPEIKEKFQQRARWLTEHWKLDN